MAHRSHKIIKRKDRRRIKTILYPFHNVHFITISVDGLTEEQIAFFKEAEKKGLIPKITWIDSKYDSTDDKMKFALLYLHTEDADSEGCQIKHHYDYAWIKMAIDHGPIPSPYWKLRHRSTPAFVKYIQWLGFTDIAGSKTLNKVLAKAKWYDGENRISFPKFGIGILECKRRNRIAMKFLELINEL